jgi:prepilin-type N-terminal cleavage/methylation domain-containing protein
MTTRRRRPDAFTLIELVLVLVVLTVLLAIAAPSLRGWSKGAKLRDATDQVLTATRFARSQAVTTAAVHRVEVDPEAGAVRVTVQDGEQFVPAAGEGGRQVVLSPGIRPSVVRDDGDTSGTIEFRPDGRTTPATLTLTADWGETTEIVAASAAEPFRLATADDDR